MANLKKEIITNLADNQALYGSFRTSEAAMAEFIDKNPGLAAEAAAAASFTGAFKHFYNRIFEKRQLDDETSELSILLAKYRAEGKAKRNLVPSVAEATPREPLVIRTINTANYVVPEAMFRTYMTNTIFDELHSDDGGAMAACSTVVVGGPGVGKSTLMFWMASQFKLNETDIKIAVISSEMEIEDLLYEARRKPWMNTIEFILTSEYQEELKEALTQIFLGGYHMIILDSFADICDKLRDFCNMTSSAAETWLLDLMKKAKGGANSDILEEKIYTATFAIQQQTKGGSFAGSNKLKHNTTAMLELRKEKSGDRYMVYTKNRRCGSLVGKRMFYYLGANNQVSFDGDRWDREKMEGAGHDAIGQQQEALDQASLANFDQLDEAAAQRLREALSQSEIQLDDQGNPIIPNPTAQAVGSTEEAAIEFPNGMTSADIVFDEGVGQYVMDLPDGGTLMGLTRDAVISQAMNLSSNIETN